MKYVWPSILLVVACLTSSVVAQSAVIADSSKSPIQPTDLLLPADSVTVDSLTPAERAARSFEERMRKAREQSPPKLFRPRLSVYDSLCASFLPARLNQREWLTRSYYMNASDYFKFNPGYFTQRWQLTPGRTTIQPFGVAGDRLGYVHDGESQHPFEHLLEPDGTTNVEDFSTALDDGIFLMPAATGMIFGADQAIATLVTTPLNPQPRKPESGFLLDKGNYGFSHARGRYASRFTDGRLIELGIGYRIADGNFVTGGQKNTEDAYFYDGNVFIPVGAKNGLTVNGHLYSRQGPQFITPQQSDNWANRDRFDRNLKVQFSMGNDSQTVRTDVAYRHLRQGSYLTSSYNARFNYTGHAIDFGREWYAPGHLTKLMGSVDRLEYDNAYYTFVRHTSELSLLYAKPHQTNRLAARIGGKYVEEFRVLPYASLVLLRESESFLLQASAGYVEKAPSQHELYLPFQSSQLYGTFETSYADAGNRWLKPERQMTGSVHLELGRASNALSVEVVGGKIIDGIEWERELISLTTSSAWRFSPVNTDLAFATYSLQKKFTLGDWLRVLGGGSYFDVAYAEYASRPYQPEYNLFGGIELHHYWRSKLIHFWGYGEIQYTGPYSGWEEESLGENAVFNGKLSFSMGNFRFKIVYQNALDLFYQSRDYFQVKGRVVTWGFDWNFFD